MDGSTLQGLSAPSLADQAYDAIRTAIAHGELPPGEKITERGLAAQLSVSATPVREAIRRLEQEGLLERRGSRSTVVRDMSESSGDELRLIEASLKSIAIHLAATNATPEAIDRMEDHLDEADRHRDEMLRAIEAGEDYPAQTAELMLLALRSFHVEAEGACGNAVLMRMLSTVNAFNFRNRATRLKARLMGGPIISDRYDQHRDILAAIRGRDPDRAEALMSDHARRSIALYGDR